MKIIRELGVYQRNGEKFITSIPLDINKLELIRILKVDIKTDPDVLKIYGIDNKRYFEFSKLVPNLLKYNLEDVEIFYECFQA